MTYVRHVRNRPSRQKSIQPPAPDETKRYLKKMDETIAEMKRRKKSEREAAHERQKDETAKKGKS